jgi:single-stranded-DNA-specific exonuclease
MGNPGVRLMVPSARVSDVRTMGQEGKHARFSLHSGSHRALGVAFGRSSLGVDDDEAVDAAVRLEVNHWNGSVEPRVVLRELYPLEDPAAEKAATAHACDCGDSEWWRRFEFEFTRDLEGGVASYASVDAHKSPRALVQSAGAVNASIAELVSSGAGVLAVSADASRRAALASGATGLARFNGGAARVACHRCGADAIAGLATRADGGLALTDYEALRLAPELSSAFEHLVLVDPPESPVLETGALAHGFQHVLYTDAEREFARSALAERAPSRETVAAVFRRLRDAGEVSGAELRETLVGDGPHPLAPETAARCLRVLRQLDLVRGEPGAGDGVVGVVSSEGTDLERSAAFRAYSDEFSEARQFLERPKLP